ncbi:MAG TPA: hypothetical protein VFG50_00170 [Rhodothermales bacterium]|nr:hypothetical protein [Rhodothermales bacterium]
MEDKEMYEKGEVVVFDYADDESRIVWDLHFEIGDAIAVLLRRTITQGDILREMGAGGPWAWGGFRTEWIEAIAERVEWVYDNRLLFTAEEVTMPVREQIQANAAPVPNG